MLSGSLKSTTDSGGGDPPWRKVQRTKESKVARTMDLLRRKGSLDMETSVCEKNKEW